MGVLVGLVLYMNVCICVLVVCVYMYVCVCVCIHMCEVCVYMKKMVHVLATFRRKLKFINIPMLKCLLSFEQNKG